MQKGIKECLISGGKLSNVTNLPNQTVIHVRSSTVRTIHVIDLKLGAQKMIFRGKKHIWC